MSAEKSCETRQWKNLSFKLKARLASEAERGLVDRDILPAIYALNSKSCIATASSCSGRIAIVSAPSPGDKARGGVVAKWHRTVTVEELLRALTSLDPNQNFVWVTVQPPMITLYTCSRDAANTLVRYMLKAGFKYTCSRAVDLGNGAIAYYISVFSTERVDIPIYFRGSAIVNPRTGTVRQLADLVNTYLSLSKQKLERLIRAVAVASLHVKC
jgi:tRNA wybutosine-synthesizing protein 3